MSDTFYLSIDPGDTSGWASFREDGTPITLGQVSGPVEVYELLEHQGPKLLVVENFELFPWKSKDLPFNQMFPVQLIGAINYWAWLHKVRVVLQKPNVKAIAYRWAGVTPAKNHAVSHQLDAYVHGIYYLQSQKILTPMMIRSFPGNG